MNQPNALNKSEARRQRRDARLRYWQDSYTLWRRNHLMVVGTGIIVFLLLVAAVAPLLATHDPYEQILPDRLLPPSAQHYFGTDNLGRDIYSRVVYGSRVTLTIAFLVAVISTPLGLVIGVLAGYFGGTLDEILMRLSDVFLAFPKLILAIALILVGAEVAKSGIVRLVHPQAIDAPGWVLITVGVTILVKGWMAIFARKLARLTASHILEIDAWNHMFDIICTLMVRSSSQASWPVLVSWLSLGVSAAEAVTGTRMLVPTNKMTIRKGRYFMVVTPSRM